MRVRRVVAGSWPGQDSAVLLDDLAPASHDFRSIPGMSDTTVWEQAVHPDGALTATDSTTTLASALPGAGHALFKIVRFPPDSVYRSPSFDQAAATRETAEATPGLAETFEPDSSGMHRTPTLDFVTVLEGELTLTMGDGSSVALSAGDTVVQGAGRHRWGNPTERPAVISVVQLAGGAST